ncbi:hypothetical protein [Nocardia abscessus]|uniref:hypothetical protein n=1 Tax=Nocardia abscessus TaxID=120957 RepID=UPI002455F967|nr:hypothetical protein [Nocardia abscessus]
MPDGDIVRVGSNRTGHKATSLTAVNPYNQSAIYKVGPEGSNVVGDIDGLEARGAGRGSGVKAIGGGTLGPGVHATGGGNEGAGVKAIGGQRGIGVHATGGIRSVGVHATGGSRAAGVRAIGGDPGGAGIKAEGHNDGEGVDSIGGTITQQPGVTSTPGYGVRAEGGSTNVSPASAANQREGHGAGLLAQAGRITVRPNKDANAVPQMLPPPPSQVVTLNELTNVGGFGLGAAEESLITSISTGGETIELGSPSAGAGLIGRGGSVCQWFDVPAQQNGGHWETVPNSSGGPGVVGVGGGAKVPSPVTQRGAGGVFTAHQTAQIRLIPTVQANNPVGVIDGEAGDLLVTNSPDNLAELWFLKRNGNQDWVKIA